MHLLHDKHKALCAASTRIVNQRALDIEGAALRAVAATKHERHEMSEIKYCIDYVVDTWLQGICIFLLIRYF